MSGVIKLSSPATKEFWEILVLFEDDALLAIDKPSRLLTSPDRYDPARPNLMKLLHSGIELKKPWAASRRLEYLMNAHRLDFETSGVLLLGKNKPALVALANLFGSEKPLKHYTAIVSGTPDQEHFVVDAKLAPHPIKPGLMRVDSKNGKRSRTEFRVLEKFSGFTLLECRPLTGRTHQIRVHAKFAGFPVVADTLYGGPQLMLSDFKRDYRLKHGRTERPLIPRVALHAQRLEITHPITGEQVHMESPLPRDFQVALKYLRKYGAPSRVS